MATDRQKFLKASELSGFVLAAHPRSFAEIGFASNHRPYKQIALPSYPQMEWQDAELGIIFHFDISIATKNLRGDNQSREIFNPKDYIPVKLDLLEEIAIWY